MKQNCINLILIKQQFMMLNMFNGHLSQKYNNYILSMQLSAGMHGDEDGFKLWQSLVRQTELTAQLCSITRDVRNVRGNTQKKIEKLRQLLSGLLSELTYFEEVLLWLEFDAS